MSDRQDGGPVYLCPMHREVRQAGPGKCQRCGMALVPEGARFALLQHVTKNPMALAILAAVAAAVLIVAMNW